VKGLEYLIRAIASVRNEQPRVHLVLAGGWRSLALPCPAPKATPTATTCFR
jgi:glycosyltransferase involved in cell wall biosynthesis